MICIIHTNKNTKDKTIQLMNHRMDDVCQHIPEEQSNTHGFHIYCYQQFTNEKNLQKHTNETTEHDFTAERRKKTTILFPEECIIIMWKTL